MKPHVSGAICGSMCKVHKMRGFRSGRAVGMPKMDEPAEREWLGAATPVYSRCMKILAVAAVSSTSVIEVHYRQLLEGVRLSEPVAAFVSYVSFASVSLLLGGAVLRGMFWAIDRSGKIRETNRRG